MFDICPFCCFFFFLNYLIGRGLIIMPIYLTTFHGIEKKSYCLVEVQSEKRVWCG